MMFRMRLTWMLFVAWSSVSIIAARNMHLAYADSAPKNFIIHAESKPAAAITFADESGQTRSLANFMGKVMVLNVWATWCAPCRKEMPTLDRLQAALGGPDFDVFAVSVDRGGIDTVRSFYAGIGVRHLAIYVDTSAQAVRQIGAVGLPTTLIIDRRGQEIGRVAGPAEWDSTDVTEFLKLIIARRNGIATRVGQTEPADAKADRSSGPIERGLDWLKAFFRTK